MKRNSIVLFYIVLVLILFCTACSNSEQQFQFPLKTEDMEKALADQKLSWTVERGKGTKDSESLFILNNNDGVSFGVGANKYESGKILYASWLLPTKFTAEQFNKFYSKDLPQLFDLVSILYGNNREIKKGLKEFSKYYEKDEGNFEGGIYWTKRIGDDHVRIEIRPFPDSKDNRNRVGTLLITYSGSYEQYLQALSKAWKNTAQTYSIKINNNTVDGIKKLTPPVNEEDVREEHFVLRGHLEDVKEIKTVPESLKNIKSHYLKSNKDKYLSAKLVDDTGSVDVFLQTTSLNAKELSMERDHYVMLVYWKNNPYFVVRLSTLKE